MIELYVLFCRFRGIRGCRRCILSCNRSGCPSNLRSVCCCVPGLDLILGRFFLVIGSLCFGLKIIYSFLSIN